MNVLILTGWGHHDYAAAAAATLKIFGNKADVCGVSRRRLPELLGEAGSKWDKIVILGVSLSADVPMLAKSLENLKKKGVKVFWISAFDAPENIVADLKGLLDRRVGDCDTILDAVGAAFKKDVSEFLPYLAEGRRRRFPRRSIMRSLMRRNSSTVTTRTRMPTGRSSATWRRGSGQRRGDLMRRSS